MYYNELLTKAFRDTLPEAVCFSPPSFVTDIVDRCAALTTSDTERDAIFDYIATGAMNRHIPKFIARLRQPPWIELIRGELSGLDMTGLALICYVPGVTRDMVSPTVSLSTRNRLIEISRGLPEPMGLTWRKLLIGAKAHYVPGLAERLQREPHYSAIINTLTRRSR